MAITPSTSLLHAIAEHAHRAIERPAAPRPTPPPAAPGKTEAAAGPQQVRADGAAAAPSKTDPPAAPRRDLPRGSIVNILA